MDKDIADKVLLTVMDCSAELSSLVPFLKEKCDDEAEYSRFGKGIAKVIAHMYYEVKRPIYELYPELEEAYEKKFDEPQP